MNCGLIGLLGPVHRIFPDITPVQQVILIIILEVGRRIRKVDGGLAEIGSQA